MVGAMTRNFLLSADAPIMKRTLAVTLFLALSLLPAAARDAATAERQIREALESWRRAFNAGDAGHVCDLFAPDLISNYQGQPERNYDSLCALLRGSLQDKKRAFDYGLDVKEILVSGDMAIVRLIWTLRITQKSAGETRVSEEPGLDVFRRGRDGRWRIIRYLAYPATP